MEGLKDKTSDLVDHVEDIADTFYKLALLNISQKSTNLASSFLVIVVLSVFVIFSLLFGGIALSLWMGTLVGSQAGGFLIGAGVFAVVLGVIVLMRKKIVFPFIRNLIIRKVYD